MEKLMNEENEWDHRISAGVKEGPADCIRIDEVATALKKMKRHNAPGLLGLVAEMIQATGILELSGYWIYMYVMVKGGCIHASVDISFFFNFHTFSSFPLLL